MAMDDCLSQGKWPKSRIHTWIKRNLIYGLIYSYDAVSCYFGTKRSL